MSEFVKCTANKDGHRAICYLCQRESQKKVYQRNPTKRREQNRKNFKRWKNKLQAEIDQIKSVPCMDCGKTYAPIAMDFDHRNGKIKIAGISDMICGYTASREKIMAEIAKCDIVCAICHRIRTHNRRVAQRVAQAPD